MAAAIAGHRNARQPTRSATGSSHRLSWFEFGLGMFALAVPVGVALLTLAPVDFVRLVGACIVGTAIMGIWISAAGLKLEHPERWQAVLAAMRRRTQSRRPSDY